MDNELASHREGLLHGHLRNKTQSDSRKALETAAECREEKKRALAPTEIILQPAYFVGEVASYMVHVERSLSQATNLTRNPARVVVEYLYLYGLHAGRKNTQLAAWNASESVEPFNDACRVLKCSDSDLDHALPIVRNALLWFENELWSRLIREAGESLTTVQ